MASIASKVKRKVKSLPSGSIFSLEDLSKQRDEVLAVAVQLSRMAKSGEIKRVSKGRYFKPRQSVFGELRPAQSEILRQWIGPNFSKPAYITGIALYNKLGLTNQVPVIVSLAYNKERAPIKVADVKIKFIRQNNKITKRSIALLQILDVIKGYNKIPDKEDEVVMSWLKHSINSLSGKQRKSLVRLAEKYNPSSRALLGAILDHLEFRLEADEMKKFVNPLSRFKINIQSWVLPNKEEWGII